MAPPRIPLVERIITQIVVNPETACWHWCGELHRKGYALLRVRNMQGRQKWRFAHRVAFEEFRGRIPDGLVIDHLCRTRDCVNPFHLDPVTAIENFRRGNITGRPKITHCAHGHEMAGKNVYIWQSVHRKTPFRFCRTCRKDYQNSRAS